MHRIKDISVCTSCIALLMILVLVSVPCYAVTTSKHKAFVSPDEALKAMVDAVKAKDVKSLQAIFGPGAKGLITTGNEILDKEILESFISAYNEKSRIEIVDEKKAIFYVGNNEWPFPIPVVKQGEKWYFDTREGRDEILRRRTGRNELNTMQACLAYVDAQKEYAKRDYDRDGLFEYAQKFMSDPGKKNGLYWETKEGEERSPMGSFMANARREGYGMKKTGNRPVPYHGYLYRIITAQGKNASGGAYDYIVNGKMIGGFALVAYPARYGNSGVMTFIVNQDGFVYEKDLGKNTARVAESIKTFDPDSTWKKVRQ